MKIYWICLVMYIWHKILQSNYISMHLDFYIIWYAYLFALIYENFLKCAYRGVYILFFIQMIYMLCDQVCYKWLTKTDLCQLSCQAWRLISWTILADLPSLLSIALSLRKMGIKRNELVSIWLFQNRIE